MNATPAAFIPNLSDDMDTSYFMERGAADSEIEDSPVEPEPTLEHLGRKARRLSSRSTNDHDHDECDSTSEMFSTPSESSLIGEEEQVPKQATEGSCDGDEFLNFSFKNLNQLASYNMELLSSLEIAKQEKSNEPPEHPPE
ncbi:hypothetical protein CYMTET_24842 [Cymbomonas tetramitiformis]|uniref:Uncharacterized protein n=1 Tax=Cymbomonas tetramitiformis TaxID=36881 RepID=A0AAE0FWI1_9CHLO|nr:hypothetical protein CYMTET_24842 [Cymbomonas tetramitiformis]